MAPDIISSKNADSSHFIPSIIEANDGAFSKFVLPPIAN